MLTLSQAQEDAASSEVTEPQYLIEVDLEQPHYFSTFADNVLHEGNTYRSGQVKEPLIDSDYMEFKLWNGDYSRTVAAIEGVFKYQPIKGIWAYGPKEVAQYVNPGYWSPNYMDEMTYGTPEPITIFEGFIYDIGEIGDWILLTAERLVLNKFPHVRNRPPRANHVPQEGYILPWDGDLFEIKGTE